MCNKDNNITEEELDRLLPTDEETGLLGEAFARMNGDGPDVGHEWAMLKARIEEKPRRRIFRLVPAVIFAAAACVAFFFILRTNGGEDISGPQPVIVHEASGASEVMLTCDDGSSRPVSGEDVSFATKGKAAQSDAGRMRMTTPRGKECNLTLADGTRVWLNAESSIEFPAAFTGRRREVKITGEAYFEVAHDAQRPFVVTSDYYSATVLGTTFDARAYSKTDASVVLVEGRLKVAALSAKPGQGGRVITPGTQAVFSPGGNIAVADVDTYPYVQRRNGFFYFDNEPLLDIMLELGRWYNKTIVFENPEVMKTRLHFVAERSQSFVDILKSLCELDDIDIQLSDDDVTIR